MPSKHDPVVSLADILENPERIERYVAGLDREALGGDTLRRDAVERCLERICEAAFRLGEKAAELAPSQPWGDIRGMGNRLRHAYDRIDLDVLWNTIRDRLPSLKSDVEQALLGILHIPVIRQIIKTHRNFVRRSTTKYHTFASAHFHTFLP
jgi:uncharacterized protein with HEPN domain